MKKLMFMLIATTLVFAACSKQEEAKPAMNAKFAHAMINLPSMQCKSCAKTITKAASAVAGVKEVKVDVKGKVAHVSFDDGAVQLAAIEKAISLAGYDANETKKDPAAYNDLDDCCKLPEDSKM